MRSRPAASIARCALLVIAAACRRGDEASVDTPAAAPAVAATPATPPTPATPAIPAVGVPRDSALQSTAPRPPSTPPARSVDRSTTDSVRGIVAVVGSQPMTQLVVRPGDGSASVRIEGTGSAGLSSLSGAEVVVWGSRADARTMTASSFAIRTVDGAPAVDGILERSGESYALRLADGRRRTVTRPSPALRERVGARVWVTGAADAEPQAFGVIE